MAEESQKPESVVATGSRVWRVLGILLGTATCISLVKNGFAIELYGLPLKVYQQYAWMRDMLFWPVVELLRYFGLTMPWWLKDFVVAYGLIGTTHLRSERQHADADLLFGYYGRDLYSLGQSLILHSLRTSAVGKAVRWPYRMYRMWRTWRIYSYNARHAPEDADFNRQVAWLGRTMRSFVLLVLSNLLLVILCSAAFFFWNYLDNLFGPGS